MAYLQYCLCWTRNAQPYAININAHIDKTNAPWCMRPMSFFNLHYACLFYAWHECGVCVCVCSCNATQKFVYVDNEYKPSESLILDSALFTCMPQSKQSIIDEVMDGSDRQICSYNTFLIYSYCTRLHPGMPMIDFHRARVKWA